MSIAAPRMIAASNLSVGWGEVFLATMNSTRRTRTPILLSVSNFSRGVVAEDKSIRQAVDGTLAQFSKNTVAVSGMTILPYDLWLRRGRPGWQDFHELCVRRFYPRLKACDSRNRLGTYFERMMSFSGLRADKGKTVDQLGFVIELLKKSRRPRESALQLSCFDPAKDHTGQPVRGFPCLQQVGIAHDGGNKIAVHAFYPTQYIFDRGYGNYLGLCHLGIYIAHQTGLKFDRLNCYIGEPQLGDVNKGDLTALTELTADRLAKL